MKRIGNGGTEKIMNWKDYGEEGETVVAGIIKTDEVSKWNR